MELQEKILQTLRNAPEVTALGFSKRELEAAASLVEGVLKVQDDDTDETIEGKVAEAVKAELPTFRFVQSVSDRKQQQAQQAAQRRAADTASTADAAQALDTAGTRTAQKTAEPRTEPKAGISPDMEALKAMVKDLTQSVSQLKEERTADSRRSRFIKTLTDGGLKEGTASYQRHVRNFGRMRFQDEEDFNSFLAETGEGVKEEVQASADARLSKDAPRQPKGDGDKAKKMDEKMLDEVVALI